MMAGMGTGIKPKRLINHRKGKRIAKAAKTPKIAPDAPIHGTLDVWFI